MTLSIDPSKIPVELLPRLSRIKLIVSDMDGTLLDSEHRVPAVTMSAISRFEELSIPDSATSNSCLRFAVGTGRCRETAALPFSPDFGFCARPGSFLNGSVTYGIGGRLVASQELPASVVEAVVSELSIHAPHDLTILLCKGGDCLSLQPCAFAHYLAAKYRDPMPHIPSNTVTSCGFNTQESFDTPNMLSILVRDSAMIDKVVLPKLRHSGICEIAQTAHSLPNLVSIVPLGTTKAAGLISLAKELGIHTEEIAAIGDALNDLEMIKIAGVGVAVDNAHASLKAAADWVVNSNDHEQLPGVAQLIESIIYAKSFNA